MKIKIINTITKMDLESQVNRELKGKPDESIKDIKHTVSVDDGMTHYSVMIVYFGK